MSDPAWLDVHSGLTSSRRHAMVPWPSFSRTATSLLSGPPPETISPSGETDGGVCGEKPSGTDHLGLPSVADSAHRLPSRLLTYTTAPSAENTGLAITPLFTASVLHACVST